MDEFEARAGAYISQHQMLQKGDTVIVALSGGADSMALFHFLFSVQIPRGATTTLYATVRIPSGAFLYIRKELS